MTFKNKGKNIKLIEIKMDIKGNNKKYKEIRNNKYKGHNKEGGINRKSLKVEVGLE